MLDRVADHPRAFVVDFTDVPLIDSSGARSFELLARKCHRQGGQLVIVGAIPAVRRALPAQGVREPLAAFRTSIDDAVADFGGAVPAAVRV